MGSIHCERMEVFMTDQRQASVFRTENTSYPPGNRAYMCAGCDWTGIGTHYMKRIISFLSYASDFTTGLSNELLEIE